MSRDIIVHKVFEDDSFRGFPVLNRLCELKDTSDESIIVLGLGHNWDWDLFYTTEIVELSPSSKITAIACGLQLILGFCDKVTFTTGQTALRKTGSELSEARAMANFMIQFFCDYDFTDKIILEENSVTTYTNASNTSKIFSQMNIKKFTLQTTYHHLALRAERAFRNHFKNSDSKLVGAFTSEELISEVLMACDRNHFVHHKGFSIVERHKVELRELLTNYNNFISLGNALKGYRPGFIRRDGLEYHLLATLSEYFMPKFVIEGIAYSLRHGLRSNSNNFDPEEH